MIPLSTLADIRVLAETEELECKLAAGRDGSGQLPADLWPTYSAFANTRGGIILLGLRETPRGFELAGLANPEKLRSDLFNTLNNPQKVSANLLDAERVRILTIEGRRLLAIDVPPAGRKHRPVHINGNPLTGTYRRLDEGDRLCDGDTVRRMLAEQVEDSRDNRTLRGFGISDLSPESVLAYRQVMRDRTPNHPFLDVDDAEFLRRIGALRRDRETGAEGLTVAGLLMFGTAENIRDEFPNYHLDYQERPRAQVEGRWVDRVTLDGTWSGNLFDFYRRVYRKLVAELKVPFALRDGQRQDETPVHEALREAFVNTLVHADYTGRTSVLVVKRPDMFGFRNPGRMRVPVAQAIAGGESDGRNRTLQSMFLLIGAGERAGSGVPKIHKGWKDQHWAPPSLYDLDTPSEQTRLELRMSDLIPPEATEQLRAQFGGQLDALSADQRLVLATAATEQVVTHARMLSICSLHPVDLSRVLQGLVADGFLEQTGRTKAAVYRLPGTALPSPDAVFGTPGPTTERSESGIKGPELGAQGSELPAQGSDLISEPSTGSYGRKVDGLAHPLIDSLDGLDPDLRRDLETIAAQVKGRGKVAPATSRAIISELCQERFLTIRVLSSLLSRDEDYLRQRILNPMVQDRVLERAFPQAPNDPRQAYIATGTATGPSCHKEQS
ncbi:RNA-binding domain-containing protein [Falsiroseomonas sp. CW058]|uniref:RNA-binding domain-containing protein n=1 Tax=Falsiroseomonas sp. CW058 TaxID=3388664 RepID=UPI003D31B7C2